MSLIAGVTAARIASPIIIPSPAKREGSGRGPRPHPQFPAAVSDPRRAPARPHHRAGADRPASNRSSPDPCTHQADPVVAKVNGQPIHLSDLKDAVQGLPDNLRGLPPMTLVPHAAPIR